MLVSPRGVVLSWQGAYGPAVARLARLTSLSPDGARHLSPAVVPGAGPPAIAPLGRELAVAFLGGDSVCVGVLDAACAFARPPVSLHAEARATALASEGDDLVVASVDPDGLVVSRLDPAGGLAVRWTRRVTEARDLLGGLAVVPAEAGVVVLYGARGGRALGVAYVPREGGTARDVRHELRGRLASLHAASVRGEATVALGYEEPDQDRVDVAVVDPRGALRERPHAVATEHGNALVRPRALFVETGFAVTVLDATEHALRLVAIGPNVPSATIAGVADASATAYASHQLAAAELLYEGEAASLRLRRADLRGEQRRDSTIDVTPTDTARRRREAAASDLLSRIRPLLGAGGGYRAGGGAGQLSPDGLELSVEDAAGGARVRVTASSEGYSLALTTCAPGAVPDEVAPPSSLVRLAHFIRVRLSKRAAEVAEAERRWAAALVAPREGASVSHLTRAGGAISLRIDLHSLPTPSELRTWLTELRRPPPPKDTPPPDS